VVAAGIDRGGVYGCLWQLFGAPKWLVDCADAINPVIFSVVSELFRSIQCESRGDSVFVRAQSAWMGIMALH
jgi:hypothetical protein